MNTTQTTIDPVTGLDLTADESRRSGALSCLASLRQLLEAVDMPCGPQAADYFNKQHNDAKAFAASLGPMPPYLEGAITALAEYIHYSETTGDPNLGVWKPVAAMTAAELEHDIADMRAAMEEDGRKGNVIYLRGPKCGLEARS